MIAKLETMAHADPFIEDEAFAAPQAFLFRNMFEVVQYAAFKVVDFLYPFGTSERGRLFAADAAGAEHCDLW